MLAAPLNGVWPPPLTENLHLAKLSILTAVETSVLVRGVRTQAGVSNVYYYVNSVMLKFQSEQIN